MRVLVTGVAGFIGAPTAELLVQQGYEVLGIDNFSSGIERNVPPGVAFFYGDVADQELIKNIGQIDACIHFAGRIEAGESMLQPAKFLVENVAKTQILLELLLVQGCNSFVFSSSAAVYGEVNSKKLSEQDTLHPSSPYGFSKLSIEQSLAWLQELRGLRYASLRFFNAAGAANNIAETHHPETHLIPLLLSAASDQNRRFLVYGNDYPTPDGTCIRDYVHVSDLARAHVLALTYLNVKDKLIVNLGSGKGHSVLEVIKTASEVTGQNIPFDFAHRREGDPPSLVANIELAEALLAWTPTMSELRQIVEDAWEALRYQRFH